MTPDRWAGVALLVVWLFTGPVRTPRRRRPAGTTGLDRLGVVYMPRRRSAAPRQRPDVPVRRRPRLSDVRKNPGYWDGSTLERTLTDCADGCSTPASAEFGDHGGECLASLPRNLVIPSSGLGLVRSAAQRERYVDTADLVALLRSHRPFSQSHEAVIHNALAAAIDRRWVEPVPDRPGRFRSLLWTLHPADAAARS